MNLSIIQALKSKTVWAALGMVVTTGLTTISQDPNSAISALHLTGNQAAVANLLLGAVALWGRTRPKQGVPPTAK